MSINTDIDARLRSQTLSRLKSEYFDLLVIGAGITGCGIARDAAMRGLSVALVDAGDMGSATSSRSSKLIHGGSRYLAQGQISVVREAATERRIIRRLAPHLSLTNPMVVTAQTKMSLVALRMGLWVYEKLGKVDKNEHHTIWNVQQCRSNEPAMQTNDLVGAAVYPEYLTEDSRLTLANARSAASYGAVVATYTAVEEILQKNGKIVGALLRTKLAGENEQFSLKARALVNAAGPWVDAVRKMEDKAVEEKLQLTKGIHLIFSRDRLPINRTICWTASDKRGLFAVPRDRFVYVGTTDTFYPNPSYWPKITGEDVRYLLESANCAFAVEPLKETDILGMWAGIRPLLAEKDKNPSEISRRHELLVGTSGMITVAGGKLTSYRSMAVRVVDECEKILGRKPSGSKTDTEPLPGGDFTESFEQLKKNVASLGISDEEAHRAARLYGSEAMKLFARETGPAVEAEFAVKTEGALTLEDYWVRRSARSNFDYQGGMEALPKAADVMANLLNWSKQQRDKQVEICQQRRKTEMSILKSADSL